MPEGRIADDEIVYRRVPPGHPWREPPDRVTTANFKLRRDETGLSVYRAWIAAEDDVLRGAGSGTFLVWAKVGEIRALKNGAGDPLNLDVVAVNDETNPGHAEIHGKHGSATARALQKLFRPLPITDADLG